MRFSVHPSLLFALGCAAVAGTYAPDAVAQAPGAESAVTPPRLLNESKVELPAGEAPSEPVSVELELTIDESGHVTAADVRKSGGAAFDAQALAAVKGFEFEPARRGTQPLAVTIGYRYVFPAATAAVPAPAPVAAPVVTPAASATAKAPPPAPATGGDLEDFEATAEVDAPPREPTKHTIKEEELTRIPGTRGDALRAIEVLPGVARTGVGDGTPILRGAGSDESVTFLDGIPVPFLYHFGGVTSFFNSRLLSRVDLYPGNFSSRFGRATGGVIDVRTRDPKTDRFHGVFDLSFIDASLEAEMPLDESTGVALAGRRSLIDAVYSSIVPKDAFNVVSAPVYYDYQGIFSHRFGPHHRLRVMAYGSHDQIELVFSNPNDSDPGLAGNVSGAVGFHRLQASLHSELSPSVTQELTVAAGRLDAENHFGELKQIFGGYEVFGRGEWSVELDPTLRATAGFDLNASFIDGEYRGPVPQQFEGNPRDQDALAGQRLISAKADDLNTFRPAAYAELGYRPVKPWLVSPGVRADYTGEFKSWSVDPRLSTRFDLTESTTLKGGVGRYSQPPLFWMSYPGIGNPDLTQYHAWQFSAGVEQRFGKALKLGAEGFYKTLDDMVVGSADGSEPHFVNDGRGRIYGGEFLAEARPDADTFAFIAYTISRSERSDHGGPYRLFDHDQTHILSVVASRKLGKGWELGARFRLISGEPTTPITSSVFDARTGVYLPIYGAVNSDRDPMFQQLDVRLEKAFKLGSAFTLAPYLDVQNAYNATNAQGYTYNYDYSKKEAAPGLGLFPNVGIRGEL
jgi:TonB family protein